MNDFSTWLKNNTTLSDSSIYKYSHAANTVMKEMLDLGVIDKPFTEMTEIEIDIAMAVILHDQHFIKKNTTGNTMYSNALKQYRAFKQDETVADIEETKAALQKENISETERQELINARVGQGQFRKRVLQKYENRCIITLWMTMAAKPTLHFVRPAVKRSSNEGTGRSTAGRWNARA